MRRVSSKLSSSSSSQSAERIFNRCVGAVATAVRDRGRSKRRSVAPMMERPPKILSFAFGLTSFTSPDTTK
jgi:hypothetical protein